MVIAYGIVLAAAAAFLAVVGAAAVIWRWFVRGLDTAIQGAFK